MSLTFLWCFPIIRSGIWDLSGVVQIFGGGDGWSGAGRIGGSCGPFESPNADFARNSSGKLRGRLLAWSRPSRGGPSRLGIDPVDQFRRGRAKRWGRLVLGGALLAWLRPSRGAGAIAPAPWGRIGRCQMLCVWHSELTTKRVP